MNEGLPKARLSRDGRWAVCARVPCGQRFAKRLEAGKIARRMGEAVHTGVLRFQPGWGLRDGVWRMSQRARARLSRGYSPAFRRSPLPGVRRDPSYRSAHYAPPGQVLPTELPAEVICPACGLHQVADPLELRAFAAE